MLSASGNTVYFERDSADLTPSDTAALDAYAEAFTQSGSTDPITVSGYASVDGQDQHNQALSQRRADAVVAYLQGKNLTVMVQGSGFGETDQFSKSDPRANRCVVLKPAQGKKPGATSSPPPTSGPGHTSSPPPTSGPPPASGPKPTSSPGSTPRTSAPPASAPPTSAPKVPPEAKLGFPISEVIPVSIKVKVFGGKAEVTVKGKIVYEAIVGGKNVLPGTLVLTADAAKPIGAKGATKWYSSKGAITIAGMPILTESSISTKWEANKKDGVVAKVEGTFTTDIGTLFTAGTLFSYTPKDGVKYGTISGGVRSAKLHIPDSYEIDGYSVHDATISSELAIEVEPQYITIIADIIWDRIKGQALTQGATRVGQALAAALTFDAIITLGFVAGGLMVVVGGLRAVVKAGEIAGLSKIADSTATTMQAGWLAGVRGQGAPSDKIGLASYQKGQEALAALKAHIQIKVPDVTDDEVHEVAEEIVKGHEGQVYTAVYPQAQDATWEAWAPTNANWADRGNLKYGFANIYGHLPSDSDPKYTKYYNS